MTVSLKLVLTYFTPEESEGYGIVAVRIIWWTPTSDFDLGSSINYFVVPSKVNQVGSIGEPS